MMIMLKNHLDDDADQERLTRSSRLWPPSLSQVTLSGCSGSLKKITIKFLNLSGIVDFVFIFVFVLSDNTKFLRCLTVLLLFFFYQEWVSIN